MLIKPQSVHSLIIYEKQELHALSLSIYIYEGLHRDNARYKTWHQQSSHTGNNGLVPSWERSTSRLHIVTLLI